MGGGKTYYVVEKCLQAMKEGAIVHTNIAFKEEVLEEMGLLHLLIKLPPDYREWEKVLNAGAEGAENVWAVDESSVLFHMYDQLATKSDQSKREFFELLTMVRKAGLETYFIAQHAGNVDVAIRNLAESRVMCVNQERLPVLGPIIAFVLGRFKRIHKNQVGLRLGQSWHRFNFQVGNAYVTEDLQGKAAKLNKRVQRIKKKEGVPVWVAGLALTVTAVLCVGTYLAWTGLRKVTNPQDDLIAKNKAEQSKTDKPTEQAKTDKPEAKKEATGFTASLFATARKDTYKYGPLEIENHVRIICSVSQSRKEGLILRCLGGERLSLGASIDGGTIVSIMRDGGWFYCDTNHGQTVVCRYFSGPERLALYREAAKPVPQVPLNGTPGAGGPPKIFDAESRTSTLAGP